VGPYPLFTDPDPAYPNSFESGFSFSKQFWIQIQHLQKDLGSFLGPVPVTDPEPQNAAYSKTKFKIDVDICIIF
jgi:hypothetical protein